MASVTTSTTGKAQVATGETTSIAVAKTRVAAQLNLYPILFTKDEVPEEEKDFSVIEKNEFHNFFLLADGQSRAVLLVTLIYVNDKQSAIHDKKNVIEVFENEKKLEGNIELELEDETFATLSYGKQKTQKRLVIPFGDLTKGKSEKDPTSPKAIILQTTSKIGITKLQASVSFKGTETHEGSSVSSDVSDGSWLGSTPTVGSRVICHLMKGWDVQKLQWIFLNKLKGRGGEIDPYHLALIDGDYGRGTRTVVRAFAFATYRSQYMADQFDEDVLKCLLTHVGDYENALAKGYGDTVDHKHKEWSSWIDNAAKSITDLNAKYGTDVYHKLTPNKLWENLAGQESNRIHWKDKIVTLSRTGAIGFCQVQPFNCTKYRNKNTSSRPPIIDETISPNIYDPPINLKAGSYLLNEDCLKYFAEDNDQLEKALASYNGDKMKFQKGKDWKFHVEQRVLETVTSKGELTREMTSYPIQIKQRLGLDIAEWEKDFLDAKVAFAGTITDSAEKKAIQGAEIKMGGVSSKTDKDGKFNLKVPEGIHDVEIACAGFKKNKLEKTQFFRVQTQDYALEKEEVQAKKK